MLRGLDEELVARKYAHVERERRFLVDQARRPDLADAAFILIEDRYIDNTRLRLRRMTDSGTGRIVLNIGKKYDVIDVLNRPTVATYLDQREYDLLATLPARFLKKRRYPVEGGFGIDIFEGDLFGLELAEVEQEDATALTAIVPPEWANVEVTHDPRFQVVDSREWVVTIWRSCWEQLPRHDGHPGIPGGVPPDADAASGERFAAVEADLPDTGALYFHAARGPRRPARSRTDHRTRFTNIRPPSRRSVWKLGTASIRSDRWL